MVNILLVCNLTYSLAPRPLPVESRKRPGNEATLRNAPALRYRVFTLRKVHNISACYELAATSTGLYLAALRAKGGLGTRLNNSTITDPLFPREGLACETNTSLPFSFCHAGIELGPHRYDAMLHLPNYFHTRARGRSMTHYPKWRRSLLIRAETSDFHSRRGMGEERSRGYDAHLRPS